MQTTNIAPPAMEYYKVLNEDGTPCKGGTCQWHLPQDGQPGAWMPKIYIIKPRESGYHLVTIDQLVHWLGPAIWRAEGGGHHINDGNKSVWQEARLLSRVEKWNEQTARLFAADCAEHVLPIFERQNPNDDRPRQAIKAARDFANGHITIDQLTVTANTAVGAASWNGGAGGAAVAAFRVAAAGVAAACAAYWAASKAASSWAVAKDTSWASARAVSWAASSKAGSWDAETAWQTQRLCEYLED